ncbi:hypothetical protein AAC387_Pa04g1806 [Persea americana]
MAAEKTMQALLEGIDYEAEVGFEGSIFGRFQAVFAKGLHVAVTRSGGNRGFDPWRASLEKEIGLQISSGPRLLLMIKGDNLIEGGPTLNQIKLQKERLLLSGSATEKNALIGDAIIGALISAANDNNNDKVMVDAVTGGALATAAKFLYYLT